MTDESATRDAHRNSTFLVAHLRFLDGDCKAFWIVHVGEFMSGGESSANRGTGKKSGGDNISIDIPYLC